MAPSKVKLLSSSSSPPVPAITTRLSVRSLTIADAKVVSAETPNVVDTVTAPVSLVVDSVVELTLRTPVKVEALPTKTS